MNFEDHWNDFMSIVNGQAYGRKAVRPYDVLNLFRKALPLGSTRLKMYDLILKQTRQDERIPEDAAAVLIEVKEQLSDIIQESTLAKQERTEEQVQ